MTVQDIRTAGPSVLLHRIGTRTKRGHATLKGPGMILRRTCQRRRRFRDGTAAKPLAQRFFPILRKTFRSRIDRKSPCGIMPPLHHNQSRYGNRMNQLLRSHASLYGKNPAIGQRTRAKTKPRASTLDARNAKQDPMTGRLSAEHGRIQCKNDSCAREPR